MSIDEAQYQNIATFSRLAEQAAATEQVKRQQQQESALRTRLRDEFAMAAFPLFASELAWKGLASTCRNSGTTPETELAVAAYRLADAMLLAREQTPGTQKESRDDAR